MPLSTVVGASNELPVDSEELSALYDRFLLRIAVAPVSDESVLSLLVASEGEAAASEGSLDLTSVLEEVDEAVQTLPLTKEVGSMIFDLKCEWGGVAGQGRHVADHHSQLTAFLRDEVEPPIVVSDRRLVQAAVSQGGGDRTENSHRNRRTEVRSVSSISCS